MLNYQEWIHLMSAMIGMPCLSSMFRISYVVLWLKWYDGLSLFEYHVKVLYGYILCYIFLLLIWISFVVMCCNVFSLFFFSFYRVKYFDLNILFCLFFSFFLNSTYKYTEKYITLNITRFDKAPLNRVKHIPIQYRLVHIKIGLNIFDSFLFKDPRLTF